MISVRNRIIFPVTKLIDEVCCLYFILFSLQSLLLVLAVDFHEQYYLLTYPFDRKQSDQRRKLVSTRYRYFSFSGLRKSLRRFQVRLTWLSFLKNGPTQASFLFIFILFSHHMDKYSTNLTIKIKSIDGLLESQTWGGRMEGTDKSTELWRHPNLVKLGRLGIV